MSAPMSVAVPDIREWQPLTEAQEGIWFAQARMPANPAFMTGQALHIAGALDIAALEAAVAALGQEAECLSLRFRAVAGGGAEQRVDPLSAPRLEIRDISDAPEQAEARVLQEARQPVDVTRDPLASFTLWVLGPQRFVLTERIHHLAADGQAMVQITRRLAELYNAQSGGPEAGAGFAPYARALEEDSRFRTAPVRQKQQAHWHQALQDLPEIEELSTGEGRGQGLWFHRHEIALSAESCKALAEMAVAAEVHWTDIAVALAGAFVGRHLPLVSRGDADQVVLGIPLQNRMGKLARVPSTQVNVLPLVLQLDETAPLTDWLAGVGGQLAAMRRNPRYRGEALARELGRIGAGRRLWGPLVNILPFDACPEFAGCSSRLQILSAGSVDDLTICYRGAPEDGLLLQIDANDARYSPAQTEAMAERLAAFLGRALQAKTLRDVPSLTQAETEAHIATRNATAHPVAQTTLWDLISAQMAKTPDAPALKFGGTELDYASLERRTAQMAAHLAALGAGPGKVVAVALPRSVELIVALLSVIRAGAAYVPLDPEDTSARSAGILAQTDPIAIFAPEGYPCGDRPRVERPELSATPVAPAPDDLAYVLFTSGSTGAPKGVMIEHAAIVNRLEWMRTAYEVGAGDRILQKTPATFDVSVWEFFLPFLSGACLVVAPPSAHRDPVALARIIRAEAITAMHFVPSMLELFLAAPAAQGLSIARVFASGEGLPVRLAQRFAQVITGRLHNLYGPTEAAVDVTYQEADPLSEAAQVPIGRPVWNTACYLLDRYLRPVPDGVAGRLYLAGRQLARGYLGRADLTQERFVANPFVAGSRMYDTGDLAVSDASGAMTFVGRVDHQLKIRGVRIEIGEIEAAMARHPALRQIAMIADHDSGGQARLLAYVVPATEGADLRGAFEETLPAMMQPAHIIALPELPLNTSGKLDRKALPKPDGDAAKGSAPRNAAEARLAALYAEVLELPEPAARETDFFLAGGDSLRAVRLAMRLEEETGADPGLGVILEYPVLADLAAHLQTDAAQTPDHGTKPLLRLQAGEAGGPVIFAVHPAGGLAWCYRNLAQALPEATVYGLQSPLLEAEEQRAPDLADLARRYLEEVEALWPDDRPVVLLGWSLGGIIAQAMAAEAVARGWPLARLVLMDAYPSSCWRNEPEPDDGMALRALLAIAGFDPEAHRELETAAQITGFLAQKGHPLAQLPAGVLTGVMRSVRATNRLVRDHREPLLRAAPTLHLAALLDQAGTTYEAALWRSHCAQLDEMAFECRHPDMISPEISRALAARLRHDLASWPRALAEL